MTELREIVAVEDRQKFDELVYRRNEEMPRSRDPREHDYRHSRVSVQLIFKPKACKNQLKRRDSLLAKPSKMWDYKIAGFLSNKVQQVND